MVSIDVSVFIHLSSVVFIFFYPFMPVNIHLLIRLDPFSQVLKKRI